MPLLEYSRETFDPYTFQNMSEEISWLHPRVSDTILDVFHSPDGRELLSQYQRTLRRRVSHNLPPFEIMDQVSGGVFEYMAYETIRGQLSADAVLLSPSDIKVLYSNTQSLRPDGIIIEGNKITAGCEYTFQSRKSSSKDKQRKALADGSIFNVLFSKHSGDILRKHQKYLSKKYPSISFPVSFDERYRTVFAHPTEPKFEEFSILANRDIYMIPISIQELNDFSQAVMKDLLQRQ